MALLTAIALIVGGLLLLAGGGEAMVRGATAVARHAGVTPAVIGLTVVAAGTSLPELVVSVLAALSGEPEIAVGNVVGSNILNLLGVLGFTALLIELPVRGVSVKYEWPFMFLISCLALVLARDGLIDRVEGGLMLAGFVGFAAYMVAVARREVAAEERSRVEAMVRMRAGRAGEAALAISLAGVVLGGLLLVLGGSALVSGAVNLARLAGLSERVIGLTVVAVGTSLPELAASAAAARRGQTDIAIANLIGSNVFNLLGILGTTALVRPIPVAPLIVHRDMVWMVGSAFVLFPIMRSGMRVTRLEGALLLGLYGVYIVQLFR
jgi:cation:H+ antiporter